MESWIIKCVYGCRARKMCEDMLSRQGVVLRPGEELEGAIENAWSINENNQPKEPEYIGSQKENHTIYHYFKDTDGKYYYLSSNTMDFEKELEASLRKRMAMRMHGRG